MDEKENPPVRPRQGFGELGRAAQPVGWRATMLTQTRQFLAAPVFEDEEKTRTAGLLNTILLILAAVMPVVIPIVIIFDPVSSIFNLPLGAVTVAVALSLQFLTRRGYVRTAGVLLSSTLLVVVTIAIYIFGGIRNSVVSVYILVVAIAALLLGARAAVIFGLLSMLAALGVFYAEINGAIVIPIRASVQSVDWIILSVVVGIAALLLRYAVRSIAEGFEQARQEITERKRAEEDLRQLKEFNEGIVQGMEEGIVMENADGHVAFVNPKMAELLGYTEQELVGKHWSEIIAPSCLSQVEKESNKRLEGISSRYETALLRKDGNQVPGLFSARPLFGEGKFVGTLAVFTDLTERKAMEQQLIQAGKLAAIGQLVAGVAHELNNPLTSVVGYSQLLMEAQCSEKIKRDLDRINRQALRAARIVENLLTFARRREPRKESINLNDVVEKSLDLQAHQLQLDRISIVKELDEALPPTLADPFQMQQVFINIIGNAHQALRDWEGERRLRVRSKLAGDMIHLEFADSGPGIPPETMGKLFEPFFTTREVGQGTGLGLSISYGIVEAHGGRIWAESEVGKGATFIVEIPLRGH